MPDDGDFLNAAQHDDRRAAERDRDKARDDLLVQIGRAITDMLPTTRTADLDYSLDSFTEARRHAASWRV